MLIFFTGVFAFSGFDKINSSDDYEPVYFIPAENREEFLNADRDGALINYFTGLYDGNIDLREYSGEIGMRYIDVLLNRIPVYSNNIRMTDFFRSGYFDVEQQHARFTVVDVRTDFEFREVSVEMVLTNEESSRIMASVEFTFFNSQLENIDHMCGALNMMAAPRVYASRRNIGDFTYGERTDMISFIRGNVHVWINRGVGRDIDVTDLAEAIDQLLLSMLIL